MLKKIMCVAAMVFFCSMNVHAADAEPILTMTVPSDQECTIASGRSFYVKGLLSNYTYESGDTMKVEVKDKTSGAIVRTVSTNIYENRNIYVNEDDKLPSFFPPVTDVDIKASGMPDLISPENASTLSPNGAIKCYFDGTQFAALVAGGGNAPDGMNSGLTLVDEQQKPYVPLSDGEYQLVVTLAKADDTLITEVTKDITIGITENKVLTRFSPSTHQNAANAFAKENGYRIYNDPFPGYWSPENGPFCEILPEWREADALEYTTGKVHFVIYNAKPTSTTYSVELGQLQYMNDIENPDRLVNYYYSTGEPEEIDGNTSQIQAFDTGDKLQMTRAEISTQPTEEGVYNQEGPQPTSYDFNLSDGIQADVGETVSLYGVTAPIQIDRSEIIPSGYNSYTLNNKLTTIKYRITGDGIDKTIEKNVSLTRPAGMSELEFKHNISIVDEMEGKELQIHVSGYDAHGTPVNGSEENFLITVAGSEPAVPEPPATPEVPETSPLPDSPTPESPVVQPVPIEKAPLTGDSAPVALYLLIMFFAFAGVKVTQKN